MRPLRVFASVLVVFVMSIQSSSSFITFPSSLARWFGISQDNSWEHPAMPSGLLDWLKIPRLRWDRAPVFGYRKYHDISYGKLTSNLNEETQDLENRIETDFNFSFGPELKDYNSGYVGDDGLLYQKTDADEAKNQQL